MSVKKPVAIDDYVRQWGSKVMHNTFAADDEENLRKGGDNLYFLLKKIVMDEGTKADLEIPLRQLRDMILEVWKQQLNNDRYRHTYILFNMYERVFSRVLSSIQEASQGGDDSRLRQEMLIMDELRSRMHKCVTGETWRDYPALRMVALRQIFNFYKESQKISTLLAKTSNGTGMPNIQTTKRFSFQRRKDDDGAPGFSWEDTLDACVTASSEKLFPLLKILLTNGKAGVITMEGIVGVNLVVDAAAGAVDQSQIGSGEPQTESPAGPSLIDLDFMGAKQGIQAPSNIQVVQNPQTDQGTTPATPPSTPMVQQGQEQAWEKFE
eukprot:TRINITY_DN2144_c0_g1_i2.p1 TRINITY_DN2144_c0_g1~~TRINITY_DN2144_c0_g1_i2.p1  ORF type:complete len:323 (+),score=47.36 TRINITY_DN2144_c0_g1_i2:113-1081(+)